MHLETLRHTSSIDGTKPLLFDVGFKSARKKLPLIVVRPGVGGEKEFYRADIERLATKGCLPARQMSAAEAVPQGDLAVAGWPRRTATS